MSASSNAWIDRARTRCVDSRSFVAGVPVDPISGRVSPVLNPATDALLFELPLSNEADVDVAVSAARQAFDSGAWSRLGLTGRRRTLWRLADLIERDREALALDDSLEMGKPILAALGEIAVAAGFIRHSAECIDKRHGDVLPLEDGFFEYTTRQPRGVAALIVPWNFPTINAALKLGPALAAGNTVVLKPSELASSSALRLARLAVEAGIPPGVFNVIVGGSDTGQALVAHPHVDMVSFTGSTRAGRAIMRAVGDSRLKPLLLECGGKSPQIVFEDACDIGVESIAQTILDEAMWNQGQVCVARSRVYVQRALYDLVVARCLEKARAYIIGDPLDERTTFGPLASRAQKQRVDKFIAEGRRDAEAMQADPAQLALPSVGCYVAPTLLLGVRPEASIVREEIFGPVVTFSPFTDEDDAVRLANDSDYGLAATLWTTNLARSHRLATSVRAGSIRVRASAQTVYGPLYAHAAEPMGQSGFGVEGGLAGIDSYTALKAVQLQMAK